MIKEYPFLFEEQFVENIDIVTCSSCKSSYSISEHMMTSQDGYWLLYSRFSNEIFMISAWNSTHQHFRSEMDKLKLQCKSHFFNPCAPLQRLKFIRPHLIEKCPYCSEKLDGKCWSKGSGNLKFIWPSYDNPDGHGEPKHILKFRIS